MSYGNEKGVVKFYAYHAATGNNNYLFQFKVKNRKEAEACIKRFPRVRSAWFTRFYPLPEVTIKIK